MSNPMIQIGDTVRPMTDEEYAEFIATGIAMSTPTVEQVESTRLNQYEHYSDPIFFKWQRGDATESEWREAVAKVKADNPYPPAP